MQHALRTLAAAVALAAALTYAVRAVARWRANRRFDRELAEAQRLELSVLALRRLKEDRARTELGYRVPRPRLGPPMKLDQRAEDQMGALSLLMVEEEFK